MRDAVNLLNGYPKMADFLKLFYVSVYKEDGTKIITAQ